MSILKRPINYAGLEDELDKSLKDDTKYQLENDAKLRAIEQNVPTYEHFRQMVNGAHLKPLERRDTNKKTTVPWNLSTKNIENKNDHTMIIKNSSFLMKNREQNVYVLSKNIKEFYEKWKAFDNVTDKIQFLLNSRNFFPEIFPVEIPTNILGEFLDVCLCALMVMEEQRSSLYNVIDILISLTTCNRFQLAITFMTLHDISICNHLFNTIFLKCQDQSVKISKIIELGKQFGVIL